MECNQQGRWETAVCRSANAAKCAANNHCPLFSQCRAGWRFKHKDADWEGKFDAGGEEDVGFIVPAT